DDSHELVLVLVAAPEPLLVHADLNERDRGPRLLPALEGVVLGAMNGPPAQTVDRCDVRRRHRRAFEREALLQAPRLSLIRVSPRHELDGCRLTRSTLHAARRVLDLDGVLGPRQVAPPARVELLVQSSASTTACATAREPPTLDAEHEPG